MPSVPTDSSPAAETKQADAGWHDRASYAVAFGVIAFFLVTSLWISLKRLFWYDELMTFQIAGIPDSSTFWAAIHRGFDGMPPAYYLLERFLLAHIHPAELALRLPSVLAVSFGTFVVFDCARRLTDAFFGLFGMGVVLVSYIAYYSYEARSYALYFLCSALALWVWCHARGRLGPVLFGACFFAGMMMHDYFFICLTPYALYECLQWRPGRWPSAKLIGGAVGLLCGILVLAPQLAAQHAFNTIFWAIPTLGLLVNVYGTSLPFGVAIFCLAAAWLALVRKPSPAPKIEAATSAEAVGWFHLLIPLAGYIVAKFVTHAFYDRYFICFVPGMAVALACFSYRNLQAWSIPAIGALIVVIGLGMGDQSRFAAHPEMVDPTRHTLDNDQIRTTEFMKLEDRIKTDGKRSVLICEPMMYSQVRHYSKAHLNYFFLSGPSNPRQKFNSMLLKALNDYVPQGLWAIRDLEQNAAGAAVVDMPPEALEALRADGYRPTLAFKIDHGFLHPIEIAYLQR
ncbi:MAG TPA: glycosyltransferase family 39 protein [Bryobacteraceae bacterium]|nr:glycosyltransferase family 39 protein [Bryobacteraceae bacterium]